MASGMDRRQIFIGGGAAALIPAFPLRSSGASLNPFSASRTIGRFWEPLFVYGETMPRALRHALEAVIEESELIEENIELERRQAECISLISVRVFAPRALTKAGYHGLASECRSAADLERAGKAASLAQHTIGWAQARGLSRTNAAQLAYGVAAQGANACGSARSPENRWVPHAGARAASALLGFEELAETEAEKRWIWSAAVATMERCMAVA